jgi:hypothetical protein
MLALKFCSRFFDFNWDTTQTDQLSIYIMPKLLKNIMLRQIILQATILAINLEYAEEFS